MVVDFPAPRGIDPLKRLYPKVSWSARAVAARVRKSREKAARKRMMRQLRNGQGIRTGALAPWGGAV